VFYQGEGRHISLVLPTEPLVIELFLALWAEKDADKGGACEGADGTAGASASLLAAHDIECGRGNSVASF
jgi:hypothetical protein